MKITINTYHGIAVWRWNLKAGLQNQPPANTQPSGDEEQEEEEEEDDDDDVCGICRVAYDGCCPDCKTPGDECPLSELWVDATNFRFRADRATYSLGRVHTCVSHALYHQVARHRVIKAAVSDGQATLG